MCPPGPTGSMKGMSPKVPPPEQVWKTGSSLQSIMYRLHISLWCVLPAAVTSPRSRLSKSHVASSTSPDQAAGPTLGQTMITCTGLAIANSAKSPRASRVACSVCACASVALRGGERGLTGQVCSVGPGACRAACCFWGAGHRPGAWGRSRTRPEGEVGHGREALRQLRAVLRQAHMAALAIDAVQVHRPARRGSPTPELRTWTVPWIVPDISCGERGSSSMALIQQRTGRFSAWQHPK